LKVRPEDLALRIPVDVGPTGTVLHALLVVSLFTGYKRAMQEDQVQRKNRAGRTP